MGRRGGRNVSISRTSVRQDTIADDPFAGVHSVRAPDADLPNTAAFLGGLVAQESIKMITRQYIPVLGYCVVDLVDSWTGVVA